MACPARVGGRVWTLAAMRRRIDQALWTLGHLGGAAVKPAARLAASGDIVRTAQEAYGYTDADPPPLRPGPAEIGEAWEVMAWLNDRAMEADDRRLLIARALRVKWSRLVRMTGWSERTLRSRHREAELRLLARLNGAAKNPVAGSAGKR